MLLPPLLLLIPVPLLVFLFSVLLLLLLTAMLFSIFVTMALLSLLFLLLLLPGAISREHFASVQILGKLLGIKQTNKLRGP
jgi:hypothetical protein